MWDRVSRLIDRVKSARHDDVDYIDNINAAIWRTVKDRVAPLKIQRGYSYESAQRIKDELYTLVPVPATGSPVSSIVAIPNDYYYYLLLYIIIDGVEYFCRPSTFNEIGPLQDDPFAKPSAVKPYFTQQTNGFLLYKGSSGTFGNYRLYYIKKPATTSMGKESDKINSSGTLSIGATYYVYEQAVHNSITYYPGDTFIAANTTLNSGIVIPATVVVNCDLPDNMHEEICKLAATLMLGPVEDFDKKQSLEIDVEKS